MRPTKRASLRLTPSHSLTHISKRPSFLVCNIISIPHLNTQLTVSSWI
jgi:hypothetical protein